MNYSDVFYESTTADSGSFEQWDIDGRQTAEQRANAIWKQQLADYQTPALDPSVDEAL